LPFTRRRLLSRAARAGGAIAVASALPARLPAARAAAPAAPVPIDLPGPPLATADYFALADDVLRRLERTWREDEQVYSSGGGGLDSIYNAALLTVHATAALHGHDGAARNDERARLLAARLCESPPFFSGRTLPHPDRMFHTPGWLGDLYTYDSPMDKAFDPKIAEGLTSAWRARDIIGLAPEVTDQIVRCVDSVARGPFFRYPSVRLNQINWNAELYACATEMTGNPELLRDDYRKHVHRFVEGARRPLARGWAHNLSPSYRFVYQVDSRYSRKNVDSAEYANITLHFLSFYELALRWGMQPLPEADLDLLRAWTARVQYGYWTHAGMLSWDSGLGFKRWMKAKTWAYALQGPLTIATSPRFHLRAGQGPWAKYVFDRALAYFAALCDSRAIRDLPPAHMDSIGAAHQGKGSQRIYVARMAANAMRAVTAGLGELPAEPPPSVYAFDADVGRLSVSTPRYAAAVFVHNRGAFPYGGIELARFSDARAVPVGGVGARPPAAFGIVVRRPGRRVLESQGSPRRASLKLTASPRGRVARVRPYARKPDAGPFRALHAVGHAERGGAGVTARHRFRAGYVETTWEIEAGRGMRAEAQFPSWNTDATVTAVLRGGGSVTLGRGAQVDVSAVDHFFLAGPRGGYVLVPIGAAGTASARRIARQRSAPRPGPTLVIALPRGAGLRVRLAPAADADQASRIALRITQRFATG
jgi:hypothetical protein